MNTIQMLKFSSVNMFITYVYLYTQECFGLTNQEMAEYFK